MTKKEFERMKDFAIRMTVVSIGGKRWQKVVRGHVEEILSRMDCPNFGFEYQRIQNWDNARQGPDLDMYGHKVRHCMLPCDFMSDYLYDHGLEREHESRSGHCESVQTKVGSAVSCCIRAAMDIAVHPSGGVVGFSVGDLRKMWAPEPIPAWVAQWFKRPLKASTKDSVPVWL